MPKRKNPRNSLHFSLCFGIIEAEKNRQKRKDERWHTSLTTAVGATTKVCIYEGSLDELYKIQLTQTLESQSLLEYIETLDEWMIDSMHIYIEAENISDRDRYWR